jgi:hypothetical protein
MTPKNSVPEDILTNNKKQGRTIARPTLVIIKMLFASPNEDDMLSLVVPDTHHALP